MAAAAAAGARCTTAWAMVRDVCFLRGGLGFGGPRQVLRPGERRRSTLATSRCTREVVTFLALGRALRKSSAACQYTGHQFDCMLPVPPYRSLHAAVLPCALPAGEAESEEDEWEGGESELTCAALRQLQQSPQFQGYLRVGWACMARGEIGREPQNVETAGRAACGMHAVVDLVRLSRELALPCLTHLTPMPPRLPQARGLTAADVGASARKMRLYRRLRRLDPDAFLALLRPGSRAVFETQVRPLGCGEVRPPRFSGKVRSAELRVTSCHGWLAALQVPRHLLCGGAHAAATGARGCAALCCTRSICPKTVGHILFSHLTCAGGAPHRAAPGVLAVHSCQPSHCSSSLPCWLGLGRRATGRSARRVGGRAAMAAGAAVAAGPPRCGPPVW